MLFPAPEASEPPVATLVTTSGGLVAGDRLAITIEVEEAAAAQVTASAAEKIYRSTGATTEVAQLLSVASGGWLEFLPPETILFDGARLRRRTTLSLAQNAGFLGGGIIVFGRRARGESFTRGLLSERWEIQRNGLLTWGDALHLDGDVAAVLADPACFDNAAACATLILAPPDADPRRFLDDARAVLQQSASARTADVPPACGPSGSRSGARGPGGGLRAGVTAVGGLLVARWLGADPLVMRRAYADLACHLRQAAMGLPPRLPRLWDV